MEGMDGMEEMDGWREGWMAGGVKQRVLTVVLMTIP